MWFGFSTKVTAAARPLNRRLFSEDGGGNAEEDPYSFFEKADVDVMKNFEENFEEKLKDTFDEKLNNFQENFEEKNFDAAVESVVEGKDHAAQGAFLLQGEFLLPDNQLGLEVPSTQIDEDAISPAFKTPTKDEADDDASKMLKETDTSLNLFLIIVLLLFFFKHFGQFPSQESQESPAQEAVKDDDAPVELPSQKRLRRMQDAPVVLAPDEIEEETLALRCLLVQGLVLNC